MKPILFNTPMVKAILTGRKTMTRRVVKLPNWLEIQADGSVLGGSDHDNGLNPNIKAAADYWFLPYHHIGDTLYVRETWMPETEQGIRTGGYIYKASDRPEPDDDAPLKWRPSIFMPKDAARLFLRVTEVRTERVQDINQSGAIDEGMMCYYGWKTKEYIKAFENAVATGTKPPLGLSPRGRFQYIWDRLNKKRGYGWDKNPWVWVYQFEVISKEEAYGH